MDSRLTWWPSEELSTGTGCWKMECVDVVDADADADALAVDYDAVLNGEGHHVCSSRDQHDESC